MPNIIEEQSRLRVTAQQIEDAECGVTIESGHEPIIHGQLTSMYPQSNEAHEQYTVWFCPYTGDAIKRPLASALSLQTFMSIKGWHVVKTAGRYFTISPRISTQELRDLDYDYCENCKVWKLNDEINFISDIEQYMCVDCQDSTDVFYCEYCDEYLSGNADREDIYDEYGNIDQTICSSCLRDAIDNHDVAWSDVDDSYHWTSSMPEDPNHGFSQYLNEETRHALRYSGGKEMLEAQKKEETNLWVYDTRFYPSNWYHPSDHVKFKGTFYRFEHEKPYLYYGIELEVQFDAKLATNKDVHDLPLVAKNFIELTDGLFVAESDSSIGYGIEFISRPLSYKKWNSQYVKDLLKLGFEYLKECGAIDDPEKTSCGMHIHMSRRFFEANTKKDCNEIISDMDWIFQYYQPQIETLAQRKYTEYCTSKKDLVRDDFTRRFIDISRGSMLGRIANVELPENLKFKIKKGQMPTSHTMHHACIALTPETIEVRVFKNTINVEKFIANIQLCRNLAHAARNKKFEDISFQDLIDTKTSAELDEIVSTLKRQHMLQTDVKIKDFIEIDANTTINNNQNDWEDGEY